MSNPYPSINVGAIPANDGAARGALAIGAGLSDLGRAAGGIANNLQQTKDAMAREQARRESAARESEFQLALVKAHLEDAASIEDLDRYPASQRGAAMEQVSTRIRKRLEELPRAYARDETEINKFSKDTYTTYQSGMLKLAKHQATLPMARAEESLNGTMELQSQAGVAPSSLVGATFRGGQLVAETAFGGPDSDLGVAALKSYNNRVSGYTSDYVKKQVTEAKMLPLVTDIAARKSALEAERANLQAAFDSKALSVMDPINHVSEGILQLDTEIRSRLAAGGGPKSPPTQGISGSAPISDDDTYNKGLRAFVAGGAINRSALATHLRDHGYTYDTESLLKVENAIIAEQQQFRDVANSAKPGPIGDLANKYGKDFMAMVQNSGAKIDAPILFRHAENAAQVASLREVMRQQTNSVSQVSGAGAAEAWAVGGEQNLARNNNPELAFEGVQRLANRAGLHTSGITAQDFGGTVFNQLRGEVREMIASYPGAQEFTRRYADGVGLDILTAHFMANEKARGTLLSKEGKADDRYNARKQALSKVLDDAGITTIFYRGEGSKHLSDLNLEGILAYNSQEMFVPSLPGAVSLGPSGGNKTNLAFATAADRLWHFTESTTSSGNQLTSKLYDSGELTVIAKRLIGEYTNEEDFYKQAAAYSGLTVSALKQSGEKWTLNMVFNRAVADKSITFGHQDNMPDYTVLEMTGVANGGRYSTQQGSPVLVSTKELRDYNEISAASAEYARQRSSLITTAFKGNLTKGPIRAIAVMASHPTGIKEVSDTFLSDADSILATPLEEVRTNTYRTGYGSTTNEQVVRYDNRGAINAKRESWIADVGAAVSPIAMKRVALNGSVVFVPYPDKNLTDQQEKLLADVNDRARKLFLHQRSGDAGTLPAVPRTPEESKAVPVKKAAPAEQPVVTKRYYTDGDKEHPSTIIKNTLGRAKNTLDITMYTLNDSERIDDIVRAAKRGVTTRVILDPGKDPGGAIGSYLAQSGVAVKYYVPKEATDIMHIKEAISDNEIVSGSYNWTENAKLRSGESLDYHSNKQLADEGRAVFERRWSAASEKRSTRDDKKPVVKKAPAKK